MANVTREHGYVSDRDRTLTPERGTAPRRHVTPERGRATTTDDTSAKAAVGGSTLQILAGVGAIVVTAIGLAQVAPLQMAAVGAILVGLALFLEGATMAARFSDVTPMEGTHTRGGRQIGGGLSTEILGGITGIVLGVLAILGIEALIVLPVALIVFGAALLIGSAATTRYHRLEVSDPYAHERTEQTGRAAAGTQVLVGIAAVTLGILGLLGIEPLMLALIGLLAVGVTVLLSGTAITARLGRLLTRTA
jgi:hypothetical protein